MTTATAKTKRRPGPETDEAQQQATEGYDHASGTAEPADPAIGGAIDLDKMKTAATESYRKMAIELARGESQRPEAEISQTCIAAGKSLTALQVDVDRLRERLRAADELRTIADQDPEIRAAEQEASEAGAELERLRLEYQEKVGPIERRREAASQKALGLFANRNSRRTEAIESLRQSADPALLDRRREIASGQSLRLLEAKQGRGNAPTFQKRADQAQASMEELDGRTMDPINGTSWE